MGGMLEGVRLAFADDSSFIMISRKNTMNIEVSSANHIHTENLLKVTKNINVFLDWSDTMDAWLTSAIRCLRSSIMR